MSITHSSILVVDDQQVIRHTLALCLGNLGIQNIHEAENGKQAKDLIACHTFDAIFCDLDMPIEDGFEVLRFLGESKFTGAVIIISSQEQEVLASTSNLARLYDLRIIGCVEKPITFQIVQKVIDTIRMLPNPNNKAKRYRELTEEELTHHLNSDHLEAYFQPQLDLRTKKVKGLEALVRIIDENDLLIYPDSFIPAAEKSATLILNLTQRVIEKALTSFAKEFPNRKSLTLAFNISGKVLENQEFPKWLSHIVNSHGIPPQQIICELTETAIAPDPTTIDIQMLRLKMMQFKLSIDDFGTGYSSIAKLHAIPFNELKIDKSFVFDCLTNAKSAAIVEQSIKMAKAMGIEVVAEGIETNDVEDFLLKAGCDSGQGYLYSKPGPLDEIASLIRTPVPNKERTE